LIIYKEFCFAFSLL